MFVWRTVRMPPPRHVFARRAAARSSQWRFSSQSRRKHQSPRKERDGRNDIPAFLYVALGLPVVSGVYVYYKYQDTVPMSNRTRWLPTSREFERHMGDREFKKLQEEFRGKILPPNHRASQTIRRVGSRIAGAAKEFSDEHRLNFDTSNVTYTVVRSPMANAFVLPGNHIFVLTGIFEFAQTEDDIAAIIGHEFAHNIARHAGERISSAFVVQLISNVLLLLDPSGVLLTIFLPATSLLRDLPHSRRQELEADQIGLDLAARACYDPRASHRVFARMQEGLKGVGPPDFLSTHPSHEHRLTRLSEWIPGALQTYHKHDCSRIRSEMEWARRAAAVRAMEHERKSQ